jgi:transposase
MYSLIKKSRKPLKKISEEAQSYFEDPHGMVLFFDEARFGLQPEVARLWAKRGKRLVVPVKTGYKNFYLYAAVDPNQGECFILELPRVDTEMINLYLAELGKSFPDKNILLIWDRAGYHRSRDLHLPRNIKIEQLPPYSPELNPTERLWRWLRRHVCRNRLFHTLDEQMEILGEAIRNLSSLHLATLCSCNYLMHYN